MLRKTILAVATTGLIACGSDDNKSAVKDKPLKITEASFVTQMVSANHTTSQLAIGNVSGDRTAKQNIQAKGKSDYRIDTYENILYHRGRSKIDEISRFDAQVNLETAEYTYSANDDNAGSANPYAVVHSDADNAYVIRWNSTSLLRVNPKAKTSSDYVKARIDLAAYAAEGVTFPRMSAAVVADGKLFIGLQRLDKSFQPKQAYVAVIDLSTNQEIDTNPQADGLKGIPVAAANIFVMELHNNTLYVAGRGNYASSRDKQRVIQSGGLVSIDTSNYQTTSLLDGESFKDLNVISDDNDTSNDTYFHIRDVAISKAGVPYVAVNLEKGFTTLETRLVKLSGSAKETISNSAIAGKDISDIAVGPEGFLWLAIANSDNPGLVVMDTASDSQHGNFVELDMPPRQIEFLTVK